MFLVSTELKSGLCILYKALEKIEGLKKDVFSVRQTDTVEPQSYEPPGKRGCS